ncbi:hypothetical protein EAO82_01655 [Halopseudomonas pelagia]|uniref:Bacteriophage T5 Orf172 DNA-binding domain-containing protein n=2 Tax=Halopseudomonas pelagia TaxID=553151 RepID=A0AA91Z768_9GAMM|nr:hypothetical protein CO192_04690 [Halopseudomonas pelagia]QFY55193.1 hypothetical protein EAO82_01655 [Halopseudomonas pelagia]
MFIHIVRPEHPDREYEVPVYSIALGPGVVRYLKFYDLLHSDFELITKEINSYEAPPKFDIPDKFFQIEIEQLKFPDGGDPDNVDGLLPSGLSSFTNCLRSFLISENWVDALEQQKRLLFLFSNNIPLEAYSDFHDKLALKQLRAEACMQAYVETCNDDETLAISYSDDASYLILGCDRHVFKMNNFIKSRMLDIEAKKQNLNAKEIAKNDAEEHENLKRSKYITYLYLMQDLRNELYKIGKSKHPQVRERTLQSEQPSTVLRIAIPAPDFAEKHLHSKFSSKRVRGEWFDIDEVDLIGIVDYLARSGDIKRANVDNEWLGKVYLNSKP